MSALTNGYVEAYYVYNARYFSTDFDFDSDQSRLLGSAVAIAIHIVHVSCELLASLPSSILPSRILQNPFTMRTGYSVRPNL